MPKGKAGGKGKGLVPKNPPTPKSGPKRPTLAASSSDEDGGVGDLQAVLAHMQALEQSRGIVPPPEHRPKVPKWHETRAATSRRLQADILHHFFLLEGSVSSPVIPAVPVEIPEVPVLPPVDQPGGLKE